MVESILNGVTQYFFTQSILGILVVIEGLVIVILVRRIVQMYEKRIEDAEKKGDSVIDPLLAVEKTLKENNTVLATNTEFVKTLIAIVSKK